MCVRTRVVVCRMYLHMEMCAYVHRVASGIDRVYVLSLSLSVSLCLCLSLFLSLSLSVCLSLFPQG